MSLSAFSPLRRACIRGQAGLAQALRAGLLLAVLGTPAAVFGGPTLGEYQAKAAFLYNFTKFVEWPPQVFATPAAPLQICVLGDDPFGASLDALAERSTQGRALVIRRVATPGQGAACQILFIAASEEARLPQLLAALAARPVLTVADVPGFAEAGGMINLSVDESRVRMEINVEAAQRAGLRISSQVLRLARIVRP